MVFGSYGRFCSSVLEEPFESRNFPAYVLYTSKRLCFDISHMFSRETSESVAAYRYAYDIYTIFIIFNRNITPLRKFYGILVTVLVDRLKVPVVGIVFCSFPFEILQHSSWATGTRWPFWGRGRQSLLPWNPNRYLERFVRCALCFVV